MQLDFVGSSFQNEALRFGELGNRAPQVDLASYLMQFEIGRFKVKHQIGHFSFGAHRHLINSFSSRGITVGLPLGSRFDFAVSAMNGSSIVGFANFFGLSKRKHQIVSGTLGFEFFPKRPGGLRLEAGLLEGWLLPVSGFNQGDVNDAERSRGKSLRLLGSDPSGRLRFDAGFSRSRFFNPSDPLLNQDAGVATFPAQTRSARYLDASYDILKDFSVSKDRKANLTFFYKHETVDPLFRSLGASAQADKTQNEFSLVGAIGEITAQMSHTRFNDNLADIPSILKSLTRVNTLVVAVPLASLLGEAQKPSPLLPRLSYDFNRTRQFGAAIPVGGGFEVDLLSIPDLVGTSQNLSADWQFQKLRLGYRLSHSFQNNRQTGRELADLTNFANGFAVGLPLSNSLDINLDINADSASNKETKTTDRTLRLAPGINWRMSSKSTLASNISITLAGDAAETVKNRNVEFDVQWSYQFGVEKDRFRKLQSQMFIRYANQYARSRNTSFGLNDLTKNQTLNLGLSFTFF